MITREAVRHKRDAILALARQYGACDIRIFGSVARGDAAENSDLDLLVRFEPGRSLFDHGGFLMDLRDLLGVTVEVVSEGGLSERFRQQVLKEAIPL